MVKYFHIDQGSSRASEITEGEYEFRLRKHTAWGTEPVAQQFMHSGFGFETRFGTCYAMEDSNGKSETVIVRRA